MAAPNSTLLAALRGTTPPARHHFFKMTHSQGTVRAWDGYGDMLFGGETYLGVGNLAQISGVSKSRDLQTHEVVVSLSAVPLAALQVTDPNIRGETATITCAWFAENGSLIASKLVFTGKGNFLTSAFGDRTVTLTAHLRGRMADWRAAPQSYYTDQEQKRLFAGDTGFQFVKTLENTVVSGWGLYAESTGGTVFDFSGGSGPRTMGCSLLGRALGTDLSGVMFHANTNSDIRPFSTATLKSQTDLVALTTTGAGTDYTVSSAQVYVDIDGFARSSTGKLILPSGTDTANPVMLARAIASIGTATAQTFGQTTGGFTTMVGQTGDLALTVSPYAPSAAKKCAFINSSGRALAVSGSNIVAAPSTQMVEEGTGNNVTLSGGTVKCNGQNVVLSTTGVLLTNTGKRIYPSGGNVAADFARVWT